MADGTGGGSAQGNSSHETQAEVSTVPPPRPGGLASNSNYALCDQCNPLVGVSAKIEVSEDIVLQSATGPKMGFNFQLNAYADQSIGAWQQYVVGLIGSELHGKVNNWTYTGTEPGEKPLTKICNHKFDLITLPNANVIPAGYQIVISLLNDHEKKINGMAVRIVDPVRETIFHREQLLRRIGVALQDMAPITAFHLVLVGPAHGNQAVFSSGAGSFTYSAPSGLTVHSQLPKCVAHRNGTAEKSNGLYGTLAAGPSPQITQTFGVG
jgi:hypothetical protein